MSDLDFRRQEEALVEQKQNLGVLGQQLAARRNQLTEQRFALEQLPALAVTGCGFSTASSRPSSSASRRRMGAAPMSCCKPHATRKGI